MRAFDVVIVGGGPAGRTIVHSLHAADAGLSVAVVKDEPINVNRCAVPYGIAPGKPIEKFQIPNKLVTDFGAQLIVATAERIDREAATVQLAGGETVGYANLVLATGARPFAPPIPGIDGSAVTFVRSLTDLGRLRELAARSERVVIIGGGYIGVEVAIVLREIGLQVSLVEVLPNILSGTTEPELNEVIEAALIEHGIHLNLGRRVERIEADGTAVLDDGAALEAGFVVVAAGVTPNTALAAAAGLPVSRYGIRVDDRLRTAAANIYAAGDCAEARSFLTGTPVPGEFGTNAVFMGRVVAANILGADGIFPGVINANASTAFDWSFGSAGLTEKGARDAGFAVVTGLSEVLDRYPMMDGASEIRTKLVFDRPSRRLLGGSVLRKGRGAAQGVDFLSLACQLGASVDDLINYQYATHPELAAKPSDNGYVFAARAAVKEMSRPAEVRIAAAT